MGRRVLVLGATSAIAEATARIWAGRGCSFVLAARNPERLADVAADLAARGGEVAAAWSLDGGDPKACAGLVGKAWELMGGIDILLAAHGTLPDEVEAAGDADALTRSFLANHLSVAAACDAAGLLMAAAGAGSIAAVSSVAGERGRAGKRAYSSAKAALTAHLSAMRGELLPFGVAVTTIKPGPVDTPMTSGLRKGLLWTTPQACGEAIADAIDRRADVVWIPWFWRWILLLLKNLPEGVFKRLKV